MDSDLAGLEQKLAVLLADYHRARAENESLKRELVRAQEQHRALAARVAAATGRLDCLFERLPGSATSAPTGPSLAPPHCTGFPRPAPRRAQGCVAVRGAGGR